MIRVAGAIGRHPSLWPTALRQGWRMLPNAWWRRAPFLPLPSRAYLGFRVSTQYGDIAHRLEPDDVLNYLRWCRDGRRLQG